MPLIKEKHNQDIHFDNGSVRQIFGIKHEGKGKWFHFLDKDDNEWIINPDRILFVRKWRGKEKKA